LDEKHPACQFLYNNSPAYYVNCVTVLAACSSVARLNVRLVL